jgi:hypothetical protein
MTEEDIFEMLAKVYGVAWTSQAQLRDLTSFAELVAAAEREACAALCFQMWNKWLDSEDRSEFTRPDAEDCAAAIRARGLTSLQRQLIDAETLQSDPAGLKTREQA